MDELHAMPEVRPSTGAETLNCTCLERKLQTALLLICILFCSFASAADPKDPPQALPSVLDLQDRPANPFTEPGTKPTVLIFVSVDCPISNSYMPEYRRLNEEFSSKGVAIRLVYPDRTDSSETIRNHLKNYECPVQALRDPDHALVRMAKVTVTPEAAVFTPECGLVYHGRIDDRYLELGKTRPAATRHDLRDILRDLLEGKVGHLRTTHAVGCYIPDVP